MGGGTTQPTAHPLAPSACARHWGGRAIAVAAASVAPTRPHPCALYLPWEPPRAAARGRETRCGRTALAVRTAALPSLVPRHWAWRRLACPTKPAFSPRAQNSRLQLSSCPISPSPSAAADSGRVAGGGRGIRGRLVLLSQRRRGKPGGFFASLFNQRSHPAPIGKGHHVPTPPPRGPRPGHQL